MKFTCSRSALAAALKVASSVADTKSTMPQLKNACLRVRGLTLTIAASDLNITILAELAVTAAADGGLALDAKSLSAIVAKLPGNEVAFVREDKSWATVKAKRVSNRLVGMDDRDYPKVPDTSKLPFVDVDAAVLRGMIDRTLFSVCNDEARFHLNGVLFECDGAKARMVSTDGHRLSKVDRAFAGPSTHGTTKAHDVAQAGIIIPKKGIEDVKRLLAGATVARLAIRAPYMFVAVDGFTLAVKLINAAFPPYAQVIPTEITKVATVDRAALLEAVRRAELMSSETRGIKLSFAARAITVTSTYPDRGDSIEEIDAEYTGGPITVGLNPKYALQALEVMECDQVTVGMCGELDPILVSPLTGDDYSATLMPMRI